ncbi:glycosyltransferase [Geobacter pelophilus]|uniref:Glycosyltransferase n=1 Tax=Geoanaerobacter pelophilus TaxID=60036 RepID=A0AAW4KXV5_9BACT|nr:glycosyltransferase [Geoanaerobacter pelophilus]MBT0662717.1 glycosyltransferase [Geoanaerobacter pelophilus]
MQNPNVPDSNSLVSVIIPCYNRESYIAETVNSVLSQTWPNIELIVVDDGCKDGSRKVLESFGRRITILEHQGCANLGQSAAINLGLRQSRGDYLAILDSDDLFAPGKIEKQVRFLEKNPEYGLVYSNGMHIDENGKELYQMHYGDHRPPTGPEQVLEDCCYNVPSNALFRRAVFEKVGFLNEALRSAQDHDYAIRIAEVTRIGYMDECLWNYRRHGGSISNTRTLERWKNGFKILQAALKRYPYPLVTVRRRKAVLHFRLGQCYLKERQYVKSAYHLFLAGIQDPYRSLRVLAGRERLTGPN